jgi:hypothetical protein
MSGISGLATILHVAALMRLLSIAAACPISVKNRNRLRRNLDCRHPRRRMIQHAAAIVIGPAGSGILDRPPSPLDDDSKQGRAATPQSIVIPGRE